MRPERANASATPLSWTLNRPIERDCLLEVAALHDISIGHCFDWPHAHGRRVDGASQ